MSETNGNPFFVTEILRDLDESSSLDPDALTERIGMKGSIVEVLPGSVSERIRSRVAHLGGPVERTLIAASVIGREFELDLLATVREAPLVEILDHLDAAVGASLLVDFGRGHFEFTHSLVSRALYERLSPTRRAYVHGLVALAIESVSGGDQTRAAELAHHWAQATIPQNVDKALFYAKQAAELALSRLAPDEAIRWYHHALELLDQTTRSDELLQCELSIGLGDALRQSGDSSHREILLDAARRAIALDRDDLLVRAALANTRGFFSDAGHVDAERVEILRVAVARTASQRSPLHASLLSLLAAELTFDDDIDARRTMSDEALVIARESGDISTLVTVLIHRAASIQSPNALSQLLDETEEAVSLSQTLNIDDLLGGFAAGWRYFVAWQACDHEDVDRRWQRMQESAANIGQPSVNWFVTFLAAHRAMVAADLAECQRLADLALQLGMDTGQPDAFNIYGAQILRLTRERDEAQSLIPLLEQVTEDNPFDATARSMLARFYCDTAESDKARVCIERYVDDQFRSIRRDLFWMTCMCTIADTISDLVWTDAARGILPLLVPYSRQWDWVGPTSNGPVALSVARLANVVGDFDLADSCFSTSLELARDFRSPLYEARTFLDLARALGARLGMNKNSQGYCERALELAVKHGLKLIERQAGPMRGSKAATPSRASNSRKT